MLGMLFGAARGVLILCILVFAAQFVTLDKEPWWKQSRLVGHVEVLNNHLIPKSVKERVEQIKNQIKTQKKLLPKSMALK